MLFKSCWKVLVGCRNPLCESYDPVTSTEYNVTTISTSLFSGSRVKGREVHEFATTITLLLSREWRGIYTKYLYPLNFAFFLTFLWWLRKRSLANEPTRLWQVLAFISIAPPFTSASTNCRCHYRHLKQRFLSRKQGFVCGFNLW